MIYKILKIWANLSFRIYFRRIFLSGVENIPKDAAVLFIVNHPNSFLEACLVASFQHRELHFLVRGDMFEKKWLKPILKWSNQIPIFRFKDGFSKLKKNKSTFDESFKVLQQNKALLIFPEASTQMVRFLRPLQKGAARLAIGAIEEYQVKELYVVPTGVFYTSANKVRSEVLLRFGKPLEIRNWLSKCPGGTDKLTELTQDFQNTLDDVMISIRPDQDSLTFEKLLTLLEPLVLPGKNAGIFTNEQTFVSLNKLANGFRQLHGDRLHQISHEIQSIHHLDPSPVSMVFRLFSSLWMRLIYAKGMVLLFFAGLPAVIFYGIPFALAKSFTLKKIRHIEFFAPVRLAISMFLHALVSILLLSVVWNQYGVWFALMAILLLQLSLYAFVRFLDFSSFLKPLRRSLDQPLKAHLQGKVKSLYQLIMGEFN